MRDGLKIVPSLILQGKRAKTFFLLFTPLPNKLGCLSLTHQSLIYEGTATTSVGAPGPARTRGKGLATDKKVL